MTTEDWLVPVLTEYKKLESKYERLELDKTLTGQEKNDAFASLILDWGQFMVRIRNLY